MVISGIKLPSEDKLDLKIERKHFIKSNIEVEVGIKEVEQLGGIVYKIEQDNTGDKDVVIQNKNN